MPANTHAKPFASNTVGGHEQPRPGLDVRQVAAHHLNCCRIMALKVLKALPECDAPPLSARKISEAIDYGAPATVRMLLVNMVRLGIAEAEQTEAPRGGTVMKVYRRTPKFTADDFDLATQVYGDAAE